MLRGSISGIRNGKQMNFMEARKLMEYTETKGGRGPQSSDYLKCDGQGSNLLIE